MVGVFAQSGGSFKPVGSIPVNNGGTWQNAQEVWAKDNGVWVKIFPLEVREPASGENYEYNPSVGDRFTWMISGHNGVLAIYWGGATINLSYPPGYDNITTFKVGGWTYYRGSLRLTQSAVRRYALYRIGTP